MAGQEYITNIDASGLQILNVRAENVTELPEAKVGRYVYLTEKDGENEVGIYYSDGTTWTRVGTAAAEKTLNERLTTVEKEIGGSTGTSLSTRVSDLETWEADAKKNITANASGVSENKTAINTNKTKIEKNATDITTINGTIGDDTTAGSVKGRIKTLETTMATEQTNIDNLEKKVGDSSSGLVADVASLKTTVGDSTSGLVKRVTDNEANIAKKANSADVYTKTEVDNKFADRDNDVAANTSDIATIKRNYITKDVDTLTNYYKKTETYTQSEVDSKVASAISSTYKFKGTATMAELTALAWADKANGDVYNLSDPFSDGSDKYPAGTNVAWVVDDASAQTGHWDPLAGLTDLSDYTTTDGVKTLISSAKTEAISDAMSYTDDEAAKLVPRTTTVNGHALSGNVTVSASDVGLGNVNNTADADKPVSTATQTALDMKVDKLTSKPTAATYTKVTINTEGQVTAGATLGADDIPDLTSAKITDFASASVTAGKKKYTVTFQDTDLGSYKYTTANEVTDFPSAITVYKSTGELVLAGAKYNSTDKCVGIQSNVAGTYIVVVSL